ncbi:MAG TPA: hypothetical protein VEQ63_04900, partial [Bryobacteraceae bacterium]|nr:hypothetical protein [Bryobacteraceae bacterium]
MLSTLLHTRRSILRGAGGVAASRLFGAEKHPLGLALYTVRDALRERAAEVLKLASDIGYTEVEIMRNQIAHIAPNLASFGLRPVSVHFETPLITGNWQAWKDAEMPPIDERYTFQQAIEESRAARIPNMVFNYLPPKERGELDYYRALSD